MSAPHVTVVMSTYNGAHYLTQQLDSIFAQQSVNVECLVRDDGSTDNTVEVLNCYAAHEPRLSVIRGTNIGWRRSFLVALSQASEADFYAFSDQDDIWKPEKLAASIDMIPEGQRGDICLVHCNKVKVDDDFHELPRQQHKIPRPSSVGWAVLNGYAQGCASVMTRRMRDVVIRDMPLDRNWGHDYWVGLIGYLFGNVYYNSEPLFYHVIHGGNGGNVSDTGNLFTNQFRKLKRIFDKGHFPNPADILLNHYSDLMSEDQKTFFTRIARYRKSQSLKRWLIHDSGIYPQSRMERLMFRLFVMFGQY